MKKLVCVLLASVMAFSLLACGQTQTSSTNSAKSSADSGGKIKLIAPKLGYNDAQIAAAKKKAAETQTDLTNEDKFFMGVRASIEKDYPNYEVDYADWGWAEQLDQKQRSLLSSGNAPSLVAGEIFMPAYAKEGILSPLPQDIVDQVNPSFLLYDENKKPVAIAYKASIFMLFYNKDLLTKAGLDPAKPPVTWKEWQALSGQITKAGAGQYYGGGIPSFPHAGGALRATPFFRQMGTDFVKNGQPNLTDPKMIQTLQYIRDMNHNFPQGLGNNTDEGPLWNTFEQNKTIGFVVNGSWEAANAKRNNVSLGVAPLPLPEGGKPGNCLVGAVYLAVPKKAAHQEACFNLIREALKAENLIHYIHEGTPVALKKIVDDPSLYKDNATLSIAMADVRRGQYKGLVSFAKNDAQIWEIIDQEVLARVTMSSEPIASICQQAQQKIAALLK